LVRTVGGTRIRQVFVRRAGGAVSIGAFLIRLHDKTFVFVVQEANKLAEQESLWILSAFATTPAPAPKSSANAVTS
jgi:hypothetical protein